MKIKEYEAHGMSKTIAEWHGSEYNIHNLLLQTIRCRLESGNMTNEQCLSTEINGKFTKKQRILAKRVKAFGKSLTPHQWVHEHECAVTSPNTINTRLKDGWTPELSISTPSKTRQGRYKKSVAKPMKPMKTQTKLEYIVENLQKSGVSDEEIVRRHALGLLNV